MEFPEKQRRVTTFGRHLRAASVSAVEILNHKTKTSSSDIKHHWRAIVGEFFGTLIFIYLATSTALNALVNNNPGPDATLRSALTAGGALTAMIFALGHVSGGHLNPAVTLCIMIVRAIPVKIGILYWVAQLLGSISAAGLFLTSVPSTVLVEDFHLGLKPMVPGLQAFLIQVLVSGFLCWVVLATGVDSNGEEPRNFLAPLPIGIAVSVGVVASGPLIGSGMNPAGCFGSMILFNLWGNFWIYLLGPLVAASIVGIIYKFVFMTRKTGLSPMHLIRDKVRKTLNEV